MCNFFCSFGSLKKGANMYKQIETGENFAVCQKWEESERGWGERPDGFSLHISYEGLQRYIKKYWDRMPDSTPDEYSRPSGTPYEVGVADSVIEEIKLAGDGIRFYSHEYRNPGSGGTDGWITTYPEDRI